MCSVHVVNKVAYVHGKTNVMVHDDVIRRAHAWMDTLGMGSRTAETGSYHYQPAPQPLCQTMGMTDAGVIAAAWPALCHLGAEKAFARSSPPPAINALLTEHPPIADVDELLGVLTAMEAQPKPNDEITSQGHIVFLNDMMQPLWQYMGAQRRQSAAFQMAFHGYRDERILYMMHGNDLVWTPQP